MCDDDSITSWFSHCLLLLVILQNLRHTHFSHTVCTRYLVVPLVYAALCRDGDVRLAPAGTNQNFYLGRSQLNQFDYTNMYLSRGRVEVCINGSYGSVCSSPSWDNNGASAVCKQLGFSPYGEDLMFVQVSKLSFHLHLPLLLHLSPLCTQVLYLTRGHFQMSSDCQHLSAQVVD